MSMESNAQAIIDNALVAAQPAKLDQDGRFWGYALPDGAHAHVVDIEDHLEAFRETPRRKSGIYQVHDAESFLAYLAKHGDDNSEVWADVVGNRITGVLNAHGDGSQGQRWEDHRVVYQVKHTDAWVAWVRHDGHLLDQSTFAEHIEDRAVDIVDPSGADMLELAQTITATIGGSFESSKRLSTGERQLEYREKIDAQGGKKGQFAIPETFTLALKPFEGADPFKVIARLRLRINGGDLRIGYKLERPEDVLRGAFLSVVEAITEGVHLPVLRGTPR